jgi:8-oxo-dGTP diphosphatase
VRNSGGELAIVRTAQGCFLPGGGIENGETPEQAIQRKSREECGLDLEPVRLLGRAVEYVYLPAEKTCFEKPSEFFEADVTAIGTAQEPDHQLVWMNLEQAIDALSYESHRWAVRRLTEQVP